MRESEFLLDRETKQIIMKKKSIFIITVVLLLISRSFDFITTYLYTPDLAKEGNPIVKYFGSGWEIMIIITIILLAVVVYCFYLDCFKREKIITENKLSFKEFIPYFLFGKQEKFSAIFYKTVKRKPFLRLLGYLVTYTLIVVGFMIGTSTTFLIISEKYRKIYNPKIYIVSFVLFALFFYYKFFRKEYKYYCKNLDNK